MSRTTRNQKGILFSALLAAGLALGAGPPAGEPNAQAWTAVRGPATSQELTPLKLVSACIYITVKHLPEMVAVEKGFFARHGLDVTLETDAGGPPSVLAAVKEGTSTFGIVPPIAIMAAIQRGEDLKMVGRLHGAGATEGWWVVRQDSPIHKPEDLRGAKIGITRPGRPSDVQSGLMVQMAGLDPDRDVERIPYDNLPGVLAALDRGEVDVGLVAAVPHDVANIRNGHWRVLKRWGQDIPGWFDLAVVVNGETYRQHPDRVRAFFAAVHDARDWIVAHQESDEVTDIAMRMLNAPAERRGEVRYLLNSLLAKGPETVWDFNVPIEDLRTMAEIGVRMGQLERVPVDWAKVLDLHLVTALDRKAMK